MSQIDWKQLGDNYETARAEEIIAYALSDLASQGQVIFLTAFGPEGCVIFKIIYDLIEARTIDPIKS